MAGSRGHGPRIVPDRPTTPLGRVTAAEGCRAGTWVSTPGRDMPRLLALVAVRQRPSQPKAESERPEHGLPTRKTDTPMRFPW